MRHTSKAGFISGLRFHFWKLVVPGWDSALFPGYFSGEDGPWPYIDEGTMYTLYLEFNLYY